MNLAGNVISGQVMGDTAKLLSERFGKIVQERESVSIAADETTVSRSTQLDSAIPPSKISTLSSGEFVGIVSDNPDQKINLKIFHSEILNDHEGIRREEERYGEIPSLKAISPDVIHQNYLRVKSDVENLIQNELDRIRSSRELSRMLIRKQ